MAEAVKTKETAQVLSAVYKNVKMASESILTLMPKVQDGKLKEELTTQLSAFDAFASRAAKLLADEGVKPEQENAMTRIGAKWGSMMETMKDGSSAHLAEMMIEGATMGVTDMMRMIREHENGCASESALRLARDVCAYEERVVEQMKDYLQNESSTKEPRKSCGKGRC